jgi:GAF domain-containing protein
MGAAVNDFVRYMDDVSRALDLRRIEPREAAYRVADYARRALQCARASYWVLDGERGTRVMRRVAYADVLEPGGRYEVTLLREAEFGGYFDQLLHDGVYACDDVRQDARMEPLRRSYLEPAGIRASIDAAEAANGNIYGILCCAEREQPREWSRADRLTLRKIAAEVSLRRMRRRHREQRERAILDAIIADTAPLPSDQPTPLLP